MQTVQYGLWSNTDTMSFNVKTAFKETARGNEAAEEFLHVFYQWVQTQDDLVDRDQPVAVDQMTRLNLGLMFVFAKNPFFQQHKDFLLPVIMTSALAYISSEDLKKKPEVLERITAQVLKSEYMNVVFAAAYCTGGFTHALEMNRRYRGYSFDYEPPVC